MPRSSTLLTGAILLFGAVSVASSRHLQTENDGGCSISLLIPFDDTRIYLDWNEDEYSSSKISADNHILDGISLLAAATLAIDDFNQKRSALVGDFEESFATCTKTFSEIRLVDTRRNASHVQSEHGTWHDSCVIAGIEDEVVTAEATDLYLDGDDSVRSEVSYGAWAGYFPLGDNFILEPPTFQQRMNALVDYIDVSMGTTPARAAILYAPGVEKTQSYFTAFETAAAEGGNNVRVFDAPSLRSKDFLETTLRRLRNTFVYNIVVAWERDDDIEILAEVAGSLNMLSDDFTWIFLDSYVSPQYVDRFVGTNDSALLGKLFSRSVIFQALDPLVPRDTVELPSLPEGKRLDFLEALKSRDGLVDSMNAALQSTAGANGLSVDEDFFDDDRRPAYGAGFLYDAIMAAGIAACGVDTDRGLGFDYDGVTGRYHSIKSGTPVSGTVDYGIFEIQTQGESDGHLAVLRAFTNDGNWTRQEPVDVQQQEPVDEQRLRGYAYVLGFTLAGVAFSFCLGSAMFIYRNRKNAIVTMGQPVFLYFAFFGSSFFAFSIVFQSFDDYIVENEQILDVMCMLQVWMAYGGQILVYMALFSKLWRIKKLGKMKKQMVLPRHVIWPFLLFMLISLGILLAWTIADPSEFDRIEVGVDDDFYQQPTSFPLCTYEVGFHTALQVPLFVSMLVVWYMSYKTRELPEMCTDSRKISRVLLSHVLVTLFGAILIAVALAISSFNMAFLIRVLTNFLYAIFTVGLLVIPRYQDVQKEKRGLAPEGTTGRIQVSGLDMDEISTTSSSALRASGNLSGMDTSDHSRTKLNKATRPVSNLSVITENTPTTGSDGT